MSLQSEMTSVTFKAKTKKCKPLLSPGVKMVWYRLQNSNKTLTQTQLQVDPDTKQPIRHLHVQWEHNNVRTMFQRLFSYAILLTCNKQMPVLTKHQSEHSHRSYKTPDNPSVIYHSKRLQHRKNKVLTIQGNRENLENQSVFFQHNNFTSV